MLARGERGSPLGNTIKFISFPIAVLFFLSVGCQTLSTQEKALSGGSGVRGTVIQKETGLPVQGAHIYAYTDVSKNLVGVADHVSKGSAEDGSYSLALEPGEYYLVARKRASGANYGPIVTGDLYDHRFRQQEVRIGQGQVVERDFELEQLREPMFFQVFTKGQKITGTGIRGRILGQDGEPVQGAFATAYRDSNMRRLPDFASTLTGDDGTFTLYLPAGGKWYIGARSRARTAPVPGEPVGRYAGSDDHSVAVTGGSFIEGIEIVLKPFSSQIPPGFAPY